MKSKRSMLLGLALTVLLPAVAAHAQATRTWVSGVGDDANPCSRTAPCKTFAGAISKTAAGGEINCIDPGGFGAVTITKAVTIDCGGTFGSVLAASTNGIIVNAPAGSLVKIRNLSINGAGTGLVGIRFIQGDVLHVENCVIFGFRAGSAFGIQIAPSAASEAYITDTVVNDNGIAATGAGIQVQPTGTGTAKVVINRVEAHNNTVGIRGDSTGSTGAGIVINVRDSVAAGSTNAGIATVSPAGGPPSTMMADRITVASNGNGVVANGANAVIRISNSTVTANSGTGILSQNGGQILSYRTNNLIGNAIEGAPTGVLAQN